MCLLFCANAQAGIFKCERADGAIEFRATPCPIENSETEFTRTGIRTENTRAPIDPTAGEEVTSPDEASVESAKTLSAESGSAVADYCRGQIAKLEKMKIFGLSETEAATLAEAEATEFVQGFEVQVQESCADFL